MTEAALVSFQVVPHERVIQPSQILGPRPEVFGPRLRVNEKGDTSVVRVQVSGLLSGSSRARRTPEVVPSDGSAGE